MDAIIDAASVDTDTEARELLELILGANRSDEDIPENEHLGMRRRDSLSDIGIGHFNVVAAGPGGSSNDDDRSSPHPHQANFHQNQTTEPSGTSLGSTNDSPRGAGAGRVAGATDGRVSLVTTSSGGGTAQGQVISPVSQDERITEEMLV